MRETDVHLGEPPAVVNIGVGVHGVASRTDVFRLPELWQLRLYQYDAELTVDGTAHTIRPGRVSLVPARHHGPLPLPGPLRTPTPICASPPPGRLAPSP